jgi:DUF4097 and DUF4098 domain-containing protein YvlB
MTEKLKVLKMLEEGKITAQEAAKLLEALSTQKRKDVSSKVVESVMDGISGIVGGAFSMALGEEKEIKVEEGDKLIVKSVGSSIDISLHEGNDFIIKPAGGLVKTKKEDSTISTKVIGASAKLLCPEILDVTIKDAGGSIDGDGASKLSLKQLGGSLNLAFQEIDDVSIDSRGGAVVLSLGDCDCAFDISAPGGSVTFDLPAEFDMKEDEKVKGKMRNGKGTLVIHASSSNVKVQPLTSKEEK